MDKLEIKRTGVWAIERGAGIEKDDIGGDSSGIAGRTQAAWRLFASGSFG